MVVRELYILIDRNFDKMLNPLRQGKETYSTEGPPLFFYYLYNKVFYDIGRGNYDVSEIT